jgi:hypothetical protein
MNVLVLFFGCYVFLTIILMGLALMLNSVTLMEIVELMWQGFPSICLFTVIIAMFLL